MIRMISEAITKWLELEGAVSSNERTLIQYAAYSFLFGLLPVGIVLVLGMCFGMIREGIILIIPFMLLRKFSGGFHLKSSGLCLVVTTGVLALSMGLTKYIAYTEKTGMLSICVFLSVLGLCIFSPIENQARKLTGKERSVFRMIARILAILSLALYVLLLHNGSTRYVTAFGVGIILVGLLQTPCIVCRCFHYPSSEIRATETAR